MVKLIVIIVIIIMCLRIRFSLSISDDLENYVRKAVIFNNVCYSLHYQVLLKHPQQWCHTRRAFTLKILVKIYLLTVLSER